MSSCIAQGMMYLVHHASLPSLTRSLVRFNHKERQMLRTAVPLRCFTLYTHTLANLSVLCVSHPRQRKQTDTHEGQSDRETSQPPL